MTGPAPASQDAYRILTPGAFDVVLQHELKRAVRSQSFLTLVIMHLAMTGADTTGPADLDSATQQVARLIGTEVRATDLLAATGTGRVSMVLLDANLQTSFRVIDRLMSRVEHYAFPHPLTIQLTAACCPTDGADAAALQRAAESQRVGPPYGSGPAEIGA
jgi:GGDEF domain-containing protein